MSRANLAYKLRGAYTAALLRAMPRGRYVINLGGHDTNAVLRHLDRCCGPALCCSEQIAEQIRAQR